MQLVYPCVGIQSPMRLAELMNPLSDHDEFAGGSFSFVDVKLLDMIR
jgi:hypothetical protein